MTFSWDNSRTAFADAAGWFVRTAALVGDRWDRPGLGEWDVRALVGHNSRALVTVETYLARPAAAADVASAPDYFRATSAAAADPAVAARGRDAGTALGGDPAAAVAQLAARVVALVDTHDGTELVTTIARHAARGLPSHPDVRAGRPHCGPRHGARRATGCPRNGCRAGADHCRRSRPHRRPRRPTSACRHRPAGPADELLGALTPHGRSAPDRHGGFGEVAVWRAQVFAHLSSGAIAVPSACPNGVSR